MLGVLKEIEFTVERITRTALWRTDYRGAGRKVGKRIKVQGAGR